MTRIFDALKKAEAAHPSPPQPSVVSTAAAPSAPHPRTASVGPLDALPLRGEMELGEDVLREMTTLRVSLEATFAGRTPRIVMFVGPQGGEGASTVALQFAQTLARDPATHPLVVDANVRRPAYEADSVDRCAVLDPQLLARAPQQGSVTASNLFVLPAGDDARRARLYSTAQLRRTLDAAGNRFDWIVIDGPPVLDSPDSASLSALSDGVVLVVQAGRTKRPVLTRAVELLHKAGARTLGSVLNRRVLEIPEFIYRRI
jgi:Mrp family chromosome partitioning ATPase